MGQAELGSTHTHIFGILGGDREIVHSQEVGREL